MKLAVIAVTVTVLALPMYAHAQAPKLTKASAQKIVQIISGDKAKVAIYCQIDALNEQSEQAYQKKDTKKVEELSKKVDDLAKQLGPEYAAFNDGMEGVDPDSKDGKEIMAALEPLDKLCSKK